MLPQVMIARAPVQFRGSKRRYTVEEASALTGYSRCTIYVGLWSGQLAAERNPSGNYWRIPEASLEAWLLSRRNPPASRATGPRKPDPRVGRPWQGREPRKGVRLGAKLAAGNIEPLPFRRLSDVGALPAPGNEDASVSNLTSPGAGDTPPPKLGS